MVNLRSKKVHLLCANSIKPRKSTIKSLLQTYVNGDLLYNSRFPAHRQQAIDYFKVCIFFCNNKI